MTDLKIESNQLKIYSRDSALLEAEEVRTMNSSPLGDAVLILHGFPSRDLEAKYIGGGMDQVAERMLNKLHCPIIRMKFQGCGKSEGNFSLGAWIEDIKATLNYMMSELGYSRLWICGFGTGGALALVASVDIDQVLGIATMASPADFDDWANNPKELLAYSREIGVIKDDKFPKDFEKWKSELRNVRAVEASAKLQNKQLLVLQGQLDEAVPHFDARYIADAHGNADLRFITGANHHLKSDPRAISILVGWLDRKLLSQVS